MSDTLGIITETRVTRRLDLGDYEEQYRGAVFDVWVTPTRAHLQAFGEYTDWLAENVTGRESELEPGQIEPLYAEMYQRVDAWLAGTWLNIPADEVTTIREALQDTDIDAWNWLYTGTLEAITGYRERRVKN